MNARMTTLFGEEEIAPEAMNAAPKVKTAVKDGSIAAAGIPDNWQATKQYYTIGEVAALFGVRTSHIRFWTIEFALKVRTTKKGDRLYTPAIINELRTIYHLVKERGFTIPGAKAKLKGGSDVTGQTIDLKTALLKLRNQLILIRNKLQ